VALLSAALLAGCGGGSSSTSTGAVSAESPAGEGGSEKHKGGEASIEEFGEEARGSDREQILSVFENFLNAVADEDYAAACTHLSALTRRSLEQFGEKAMGGKGCAATLPAILAPTAGPIAGEQANGRVTKVRVEGDRAFVVFKAPGAKLYQLTMVKEDGAWRASTVVASVLVP
jgi:hypothetical protein